MKLQGQSVFFESEIGGLPIIPKHLWVTVCGDPPISGGTCANPIYDPMAAGLYVGDGSWTCISSTGLIGGPCTSSATLAATTVARDIGGTQNVGAGGRIVLKENTRHLRCCPNVQGTPLQVLSWADRNKDGQVNILDLGDIAACNGSTSTSCSYWDHPQYGIHGVVDQDGDVKTMQLYVNDGITKPFAPGALLDLDPTIDPYQIGSFYYFGTTRVANGVEVNLGNLGGISINGTVISKAGGSTNVTAFSIPALSKIAVPFQLSSVIKMKTRVVLSAGGSISLDVPFWFASPSAGFYVKLFDRDWADANNDGWVTILDVSQVAACFGAVPGVGTALCSGSSASYWDMFDMGQGKVNIVDVATVAFYFGSTLNPWLQPGFPDFSPFPGNGRSAEHLDYLWNCSLLPQPEQSFCLAHP